MIVERGKSISDTANSNYKKFEVKAGLGMIEEEQRDQQGRSPVSRRKVRELMGHQIMKGLWPL